MLRIASALSLLVMSSFAMAQQTVPFHPRDNLVSVQAKIDGKSVNAVLDSGSGAMIVSRSLATKLGLKQGVSSLQASGAGEGDQSIFPVNLKSIEFNSIYFHDVAAYAIDLDSISASADFKVQALLGYPFFKENVVRVDYAESQVSIYHEKEAPTCPNPIPVKIVNNVPVVTATIKSKPNSKPITVNLVVDLGSRHYNYLGTAFLQSGAGKALYADGRKQLVGTGTGGKAMGVVARLAELSIGTQHFHDVEFALTKQVRAFNLKNIGGSLGVPLWEGGIITFDYPKHQICIQTPHK